MERVKNILQELLKTEGVNMSLIVGRDGFVIEHVGDMEADMVGAAVSTSVGAIEAMGANIGRGGLFEVMAEYKDGTVIVAPVGREAVLGIAANEGANLGGIRYAVKKYLRELERVM